MKDLFSMYMTAHPLQSKEPDNEDLPYLRIRLAICQILSVST